jgi:membrane associated rhomboid family serine protease
LAQKRPFKLLVMNPLIEQIKAQYRGGSMTIKLLIVNVSVFAVIQLINALERLQIWSLSEGLPQGFISQYLFALPVWHLEILYKPWTILTSLFAHFGFLHLISNLLFLYFAGSTYERFFGAKRLLHLYIIGGFAGNLSEILAQQLFPALQGSSFSVVGASGSIMAIFMALAFSQPQLQVQLFGIFPLRIYMLALFFFLKDLSSLGTADQIAHFAHIGGALFGIWSIQQFWHIRLSRPWIGIQLRQKKSHLKVKKGGRPLTDDQFMAQKQARQAQLDAILDKISKKGYDALSKAEKDFLFQQSKDV